MKRLVAYHGKQKIKNKYLARVGAHRKADEIKMSRFAWLAKSIKERTPGPWDVQLPKELMTVHWWVKQQRDPFDLKPQPEWICEKQNWHSSKSPPMVEDGVFIAAMGSHADKILAVIEAAEAFCTNSLEWEAWDEDPSDKTPPSQTPFLNALHDTLSALAACEKKL